MNLEGDNELTLHYRVTSLLSLFPHVTLVLLSSFLFSFSPPLSVRLAPSASPSDVISKTRSPWQQLVTSSSPTLVFDGCFYFWGFFRCTPTSLADCHVTYAGEEVTMLPSVGSMCFHTATRHWKTPSIPRDDSWQAITRQLRPSVPARIFSTLLYFWNT